VEHLLAMVEGQPNEEFIESLKSESPYLDTLHENFVQAVKGKDLTIHSYFETVESKTVKVKSLSHLTKLAFLTNSDKRVGDTWKLSGSPTRSTAKSSATGATPWEQPSDQYPMNLSHSDMVKFKEGDSYYKNIRRQLCNFIEFERFTRKQDRT
jgi:hypothetical protein